MFSKSFATTFVVCVVRISVQCARHDGAAPNDEFPRQEIASSLCPNTCSSDGRVFRNETGCDSIFSSLHFWGANIVIFANIVYVVPYLVVVAMYFGVPVSRDRAYDKAVMCYNAAQIVLNGILIGLGASILCHASIHPDVFVYLGLSLMFLTISSTLWLFVICIDITLVITRFRWISPTDTSNRQERKKFRTYATWTSLATLLPTAAACVAELSPLLPEASPIRPNFRRFQGGANLAVIVYVGTFPVLTCVANSALFCYTSYKMIRMQRSTTLATENSNNRSTLNTSWKRYFLFLRLYLLMDAPLLTSVLAASFTDLWILKFLRMLQPILMLFTILPRRMVSQTVSRIFPHGGCSTRVANRRTFESPRPAVP